MLRNLFFVILWNVFPKALTAQLWQFWTADVQVRNYGIDLGIGRETHNALKNHIDFYALKVGNIQHPKEIYVVNQSLPASEPFVMDKINRSWVMRPQIGRKWLMAKRNSRFDLGVSVTGQVGLPAAYVWPIYIYTHQSSIPFDVVEEVRYNPDIHSANFIGGESSFFRGFSEGRWIPGIGLGMGLSVEWGSYRNLTNTLSFGIMGDLFVEEIPLLHSIQQNPQFLPALFLNFAVGFGEIP